ncbi:hypothetical protein IFT59_07705 [Rhizobium sp. CFBP 8752]|uniref:hypothetical protein n=1 Tax=Rhizobium sp. CFBP 8752 TaxID=2775301 RepID=UPI0017857976|nr:hypothetical protein [Rhizobium sp. CFBP 8752]MBD8663137.1 hypothetical protein [Rhizobium sp. CFBP 8752]
MANYLTYRNQGATRNRPLDEDLVKRLQYLDEMGITAHVISGGQPGKEEGGARTGSTRHDHGHSMDADFYMGDRKLDWNNPDDLPIFKDIVSRGKAAGITGIGGADDYMGAGRLHMGMGAPSAWGAGGKSANAPDWLKEAYYGTKSDPNTQVAASAVARQPSPAGENLMSGLQPKAVEEPKAPEQPKSHNGVLMDAYNKLTGSNAQIPSSILGSPTGDVMKGIGGIGDFAKVMMAETESLNKQVARNNGGQRSSAPVEIQLMSSEIPKKKRRGGLGGIGGYLA